MAFPASILPGLVGPDSMLIVWVWFQEFRFWPLFNHPLLKPFVHSGVISQTLRIQTLTSNKQWFNRGVVVEVASLKSNMDHDTG